MGLGFGGWQQQRWGRRRIRTAAAAEAAEGTAQQQRQQSRARRSQRTEQNSKRWGRTTLWLQEVEAGVCGRQGGGGEGQVERSNLQKGRRFTVDVITGHHNDRVGSGLACSYPAVVHAG